MLTPSEFGQKVAFRLFQTGPVTLGYGSKLADMPLPAFLQILKQQDIPLYS